MTISTKWIKLCNIICAVLLLALLVCQLLPFWTMPACTCTGGCEPAANRFSDPKIDPTCKACTVTYKWCKNLDPKYQAGTNKATQLDTSEDWTVSIQQYTWLSKFECCKGVTEYFGSIFNTEDYTFMLNDIKDMPVLVFFFSLLGAFFGIFQSKKPMSAIFGLCAGVGATVSYLTMPIFQMGWLWQVHLVLGILAALFSLVPLTEAVFRALKWLNPKYAK